jgi:hypothetical protein
LWRRLDYRASSSSANKEGSSPSTAFTRTATKDEKSEVETRDERVGSQPNADTGSSGGGDIQLATCARCGEAVDPYCEREGLLVVLDAVLLRPEAYRHALLNRRWGPYYSWSRSLAVAALASCALRAAIALSADDVRLLPEIRTPRGAVESTSALFGLFVLVVSLMKLGVMCSFVWALFRCLLRRARDDGFGTLPLANESQRLVWAVVAPEAGWNAVVAVLVQVWEPSDAVRCLGSLFALAGQTMSLMALVDAAAAVSDSNRTVREDRGSKCSRPQLRQQGDTAQSAHQHCWMATAFILGVAVTGRAMTHEAAASFVRQYFSVSGTSLCSGLQVSRVFHGVELASSTSHAAWYEMCFS